MIRRYATILTTLAALLLLAPPANAQQSDGGQDDARPADARTADAAERAEDADDADATAAWPATLYSESRIQHIRPQDQRGLHLFESPKEDDTPFDGLQVELGAAFAQQFQALDHENAAAPSVVDGVDQNELIELGPGFNLATANLYLNVQLAPGVRVAMTTFLSSRHHPDAWVKDGYLLIDASPIAVPALESLMEYVTVKTGHFEINYGDAHFRRTDNAGAFFNPFVGNYIMDAFTTEIGGEVYVRADGWLGMVGVTGGEINGSVTRPDERAPSFLGKLGFDRELNDDLRVRLTGSLYTTSSSLNNTLYGGDRAGSRYYLVMENTQASTGSNFTSGRINPGLRDNVTAFMVNPFVKAGGLELFGLYERASGASDGEAEERTWNQYAADAVYRFLTDERLYLGARYNAVAGELIGSGREVGIDRVQLAAGWFVTPTLLLKSEYVNQRYDDFPAADIRSGGSFDGIVVEGVVSF